MKKPLQINYEQVFFFLASLLALAVRFLNLGAAPLSDAEASWALQALDLARAHSLVSQISIGPQPLYIFLTGLTFNLFGSTNFLARFWPALAGALLVGFPWLIRFQLGRSVALIAAFGLALDPGLVTVSRQAGGPMLALAIGLLGFGFWIQRRFIPAGILLGLALLGGPAIYHGLIILGITAIATVIKPARTSAETSPGRADSKWVFIAASLTILTIGTVFFRYPQGLAAWAQSMLVFLQGWVDGSGVNPFKLPLTLVVFQPFGLILAILGIGRWVVNDVIKLDNSPSNEDLRRHQPLIKAPTAFISSLFWLLTGFILVVVYPGRQVADLVWVLAPMWLLAAMEFERLFSAHHSTMFENPSLISALQAGLTLILAALLWTTLVSTGQLPASGGISPTAIRIGLTLGVIALGALITVLIALGWNWEISRIGVTWGLTLASAVYLTAALWGASQVRTNQPEEMWGTLPGTGQADLFESTLKDLSNWNTGISNTIEVYSIVDTPSLWWILRDFQKVRFGSAFPKTEQPPIIITWQTQEDLALSAAYRGQDFLWRSYPDWIGIAPNDFIAWLTFRKANTAHEKIILWARSDQFPGGNLEPDVNESGTFDNE